MDILTQDFSEMLEKMINESTGTLDEANITNIINDIMPKTINTLAPLIRKTMLKSSATMLTEKRKLFKGFCDRNLHKWKPGFDLLETYFILCTESGEHINNALRPEAVKNSDITFDIVVSHHARACHIAQEILCLLKCGFPDGAHARWRALHEVSVTGMFILKHGQECAERFYWHDVIESYKGMLQHKEYEHRLQEKAPSDEEIAACKVRYHQLKTRFGDSFCDPYGWASSVIKNKKVNFADIEKNVALDHMRPYYKWASQNVHAGAKGINKKLGLCDSNDNILLVGQSNSGMIDPAHKTAISLGQITCALLTIEPNINEFVLLRVISDMIDEVGQVFMQCGRLPSEDREEV